MTSERKFNPVAAIIILIIIGIVFICCCIALILIIALSVGLSNQCAGTTSFILFMDPPVVYSGMTTNVTIYTTGLKSVAYEVLINQGNTWIKLVNLTVDNSNLNKVSAQIPSGIAPGDWYVRVKPSQGCDAISSSPTFISKDSLSLTISSVDPAFVKVNEITPITIVGTLFNESAPLVYLHPKNGGNAISLLAVSTTSTSSINGVIPKSVASGIFNLVVVMRDGRIGLLKDAVSITSSPLPRITSVSPAALTISGGSAEILGSNFDGAIVELECQGASSRDSVVVNSQTSTSIRVTIPGKAAGNLCLLIVTNSGGAYFRYSAITFKGSSSNLQGFSLSANNMQQARKTFCLVTGKPTLSSRYIYAIGGRSVDGTLMNSVENANIDPFGKVGTWKYLPNTPVPIGNHDCNVIGQYVYLVGGVGLENGAEVIQNTIYRSLILDPLQTPTITFNIQLNDTKDTYMKAGPWGYRVSANYATDDAYNPGESLPGGIATLNIPKIPGLGIALSWDPLPGAISYNIYRTPLENSPLSDISFLATTTVTKFIDWNLVATNSRKPLPDGSLGAWVKLSVNMNSARSSHAVTSAQSQTNSLVHHLYAIGGKTAPTTYTNTIEFTNVTIVPSSDPLLPERHTISTSWSTSTRALQNARAELSAFTLGNEAFSIIAKPIRWIFIGPGETSLGTVSPQMDAQSILENGDFAGLFSQYSANLINPSSGNAGYCFLSDSAQLIISGGISSGNPTFSGISTIQCTSSAGSCAVGPYPPTTQNWNSNGSGKFVEPRYQGKCVLDSAFIFAVGGQNTGSTITNTVEQSLA